MLQIKKYVSFRLSAQNQLLKCLLSTKGTYSSITKLQHNLDVYAAKFDKILKYTFKYSEYLGVVYTHVDVAILRDVGICIH